MKKQILFSGIWSKDFVGGWLEHLHIAKVKSEIKG